MRARACLVGMLLVAGCIEHDLVECGDVLCPRGSVCVPALSQCYLPDQIAPCDNAADGTDCLHAGEQGHCRGGVCFEASCGDGFIDAPEVCDGDNLAAADCLQFGFYDAGPVSCTSSCTYDFSACHAYCGDGLRNGPEGCDGTASFAQTCIDFGFYEPEGLACNAGCTFDLAGCGGGACGDNIRNGPELCDGAPPLGGGCISYGFDYGAIGCNAGCALDFNACRRTDWRFETLPVIPILHAVWMAPTGEVFAVGAAGQGVVETGTGWRSMVFPQSSPPLFGIWGTSASNVYAVGMDGMILHYNGNASRTWIPLAGAPSVGTDDLRGVHARGTELFIVGDNARGLHFDGSAWQPTNGLTGNLFAVTAIGTQVIAVGSDGLFRYNTATHTWTKDNASPTELRGITGTDVNNFYVWNAGLLVPASLFHYTGTYNNLQNPGPNYDYIDAAFSPKPDQVLVAVEDGGVSTDMFVHDAVGWASLALDDIGTPFRFLRTMHGRNSHDIIAVGESERAFRYQGLAWHPPATTPAIGPVAVYATTRKKMAIVVNENPNHVIYWFDGKGWLPVSTSPDSLLDIRGVGDTIIAVGGNARLEYSTNGGQTFTRITTGVSAAFLNVSGIAPNNFYISAGQALYRFDGTALPGLQLTTLPMPPVTNVYVSRLWAAPDGSLYAFVQGAGTGYLGRLANGVWTLHQMTPLIETTSIGGGPGNTVLLGSRLGRIFSFDGQTFTEIMQLPMIDTRAITKVSDNEIFIAGGQAVFRYDGVTFSQVRPTIEGNVMDVWATSDLLLFGGAFTGVQLAIRTE